MSSTNPPAGRPRESLSSEPTYCRACGRIRNRRGECPDPGCPATGSDRGDENDRRDE